MTRAVQEMTARCADPRSDRAMRTWERARARRIAAEIWRDDPNVDER